MRVSVLLRRTSTRAVAGRGRWRRVGHVLSAAAVVGGLVVPMLPASSASAATYTLSVVRLSSGTAAADAASTCSTQGAPTPEVHCAGYDTSLAASDQILRTGDTANVRFEFAFDAADTGVMLTATLPIAPDGVNRAASWVSPVPAACATGSSISTDGRTLNCRIADPAGAGDGSVTATLRMAGGAPDGFTFTVQGEIASSTSAPVTSTAGATFTSSNAPFYDIDKNMIPNTLPAPFRYNGPDGTPGFAIPTPTGIRVPKAGGWSRLATPVTWTESISPASEVPAVDVSGFRLLTWGHYGQGCASQSAAATPAVPPAPYPSVAVPISNQVGPTQAGEFTCTQPGGPGSPVNVSWNNPYVLDTGFHVNMWIMLWVPASAVPPGTTKVTVTASGFDPNDINGVSNYFEGQEPTTTSFLNSRDTANIVNEDNRRFDKYARTDGNPVAAADFNPSSPSGQPSAIGIVNRDQAFQSLLRFANTGTVSQSPVRICDAFDSTVQKLTPFPDNPNYPVGSYAVAVTEGPVGDPVLAAPYQPAPGYNNTNMFAVNPSAYTIEFAAGDFDTDGSVANAPQSGTSMGAREAAGDTADGCADGGTATGWHTNPNDPAIVAYASSLGLTDPFDVINRVRVTFTGGPVLPGSYLGVKLRFTVRSTYRAATTRAGETVFARTKIGDVGAFEYPQSTVAAWTSTPLAGPVIAGRIGVDTAVAKAANPTTVQAGAPGDNRTTYSITPHIAFGEDVSNTQPLRVVDHLPRGMRYVTGSASTPPDHVLVQPDGSTLIVWDLGDITGTTNQNTVLPAITFQGEADPLAPTPSTNYNVVVTQSVAPDGTALDTDPPTANCGGTPLSFDVPPTPNVPVATIVDVPPPVNYSGCASQGLMFRTGATAVTIGNAFLKLGAAKTSLSTQIEPGSADGVAGAQVGWDMTVVNTTSNSLDGVDIVDVLPYNGDGRSPASVFSGTITLSGLTTADPLSAAPNALPTSATGPFPTRAGTTFYVTSAAPASIERDPYAASNLAGGSTKWCLLVELGTAGCPATLAGSAAFRVISGPLASQASRSVRIGVATAGNADDDLFTNDAMARAVGLTTVAPVAADSITVVASQIGGRVWNDADADGVVGAGEAGIPDVDVRIVGSGSDGAPVDRTVTTDGDGNYVFPDLRSGDYTVMVDAATYGVTYDPEHELVDPTGSFDVTLGLNTTLNGQNVGLATQSLRGVVYDDFDNDGTQDAGEEGNGGVDVTITGTDDLGNAVSRPVTTAPDGTFTFADLRPGTYSLQKAQLPATLSGKSTPGTAGGTAGTNTITTITLDLGEHATGYLFGELQPRIISGEVFDDLDADGVRDAGEPPIGGVTVELSGTDDLGAVTAATQTLADGTFTFAGLRPGTYTLTETDPPGFFDGRETAGAAGGTVSNTGPGSNTISGIVPATGGGATGYLFADVRAASIAGVVFADDDNDGVQDAGEAGIGNVQIQVTGADDFGQAVNQPVQTAADGTYTVSGLRPGTYAVTETQPAGYADGIDSAGSAGGTVGSDTVTGIVVASGTSATGYRFAELAPKSISGTVFADLDGDGALDAEETGIQGVTIELTGTDDLGAVTRSAQTLADGTFTFLELRPGTYTITETQPASHLHGSTSPNGAVGTVSGDTVSNIVVDSTSDTTGYLFAELPPATITGVVFHDLDADGVQDAGEAGIPGADVELSGSDDLGAITPITVTTGADGAYTFAGLRPGTYTATAAEAAGYLDGRETAGSAGGIVSNSAPGSNTISGIALPIGAGATGYSFADVRAASIAGAVFIDVDNDGVFDPAESPIAGVDIDVVGTNDFGQPVSATVQTGANGTYTVTGLRPGTYSVAETQPEEYADGTDTAGSAGGMVNADTVTGIVLGSGTAATGYLFGEREVSISGAVFSDLDADGTRSPGDPGIGGVTIELLDDAGAVIDTTTTADDGSWSFTGMLLGTYGVREQQPASGYLNGVTTAGSAGGAVGNDEVTDILLDDDAIGYLFGEIALSAIQGLVWHDADDDGVVDAGEAPIAGVEITLGGDGTATTTTAADGTYTFAGLEPGTYTLTQTQPGDWVDGRMVPGSAGGTGSAPNTITGIVIVADSVATGYGFAERTAELQLIVRTQGQEAPVPTGPSVVAGDAVRWTFEVVNNGDAPLTGLVIEDDRLGPITCPATDIAPHSSIVCELVAPATAGQFASEATATAAVVPSAGTPAEPVELAASAASHHFGMQLAAEVTAVVNGASATTAPGPQLTEGSPATVVVTIENVGNVPLDLTSIDAGPLGPLECVPDGPVNPGESIQCTTTTSPATGTYEYPVSVALTGPAGVAEDGSAVESAVTADSTIFFTVVDSVPEDPDTDDDGLLDEEEINRYGTDPNVPNAASYGLSKYVPLQPARVLDTRNGIAWSGGMPAGGTTIELPVLGRGGVPNDPNVKAVVLNVTATDATAWGYITAYPGGIEQPNISNVNVDQPGESVANLATVPVGPDGTVRLYTSSGTHVLADVAGYYVASASTTDGRLEPVTPDRLLDTRAAQVGYSGGKPAAQDTISLQIAGRGGVPAAGASAVVLTVTAVDADGWGYITAYPGGTARPEASNVNVYRAGQTLAGQVIVPIGADGTINLFVSEGMHVLADVTGWFTDATAESSFRGLFVPVQPVRKLDTRATGQKTSADGTVAVFTLPGTIPGVASAAAVVNVTATETDGHGYITAFPSGVDQPYTSVLNVEGGDETIADHVVAPVTAGDLTLYSYAGAHLVADVFGWYRE